MTEPIENTEHILQLTLTDGTEVEVKLVDIANKYIDWRFANTPGDQRTAVALTDMAHANDEMIAAIEADLNINGGE
ncbi:MAG: hypothetical protein J7M10_07815 [Candidatus Cloacimonetes bacterium]|nr:hypothetical protein [Candidatus Cloacimonadota bacterium]